MSEQRAFYDIALVLDDARRWLTDAKVALKRIRGQYSTTLLPTLDVLFMQPGLMVCMLRFDAELYSPAILTAVAVEAQGGRMRVLKPMLLSDEERSAFYRERLARFDVRELGVADLDAVFERLAATFAPAAPHPEPDGPPPDLEARYTDEAELLGGYSYADDEHRLWIPTGQPPGIAEELRVRIRLDSGQGPFDARALVAEAREGGFVAVVGLDARELDLFESFLLAVRRGGPWPERSGRRHERFPVRLRAEYQWQGENRREHATNLSRGGLFIESIDPPAVHAELAVQLYAPGSGKAVLMAGEVVFSMDAVVATERRMPPGVGIRFTESPQVTRSRIEALLGSLEIPTLKRALVVDDDSFWRAVVGNGLSLAGFEVLQAADGNEGFVRVLDELLRLDVLILDIYMPGMSGLELADRIRRVGHEDDLAIVLLTAVELDERELDAFSHLGIDDVIPKSVPPEELLDRIETVIQER